MVLLNRAVEDVSTFLGRIECTTAWSVNLSVIMSDTRLRYAKTAKHASEWIPNPLTRRGREKIRCGLCQITLTTCSDLLINETNIS